MSKKPVINFTTLFLGFFISCLFAGNTFASPSRTLTIFAEQNMVQALVKISRLYSQNNHVIVSVNFNSSAELMSSVDSGEPADIFISAHNGWIDSLKKKGLVDIYNTGHIARDRLVLVASQNNHHVFPQLLQKQLSLEQSLKILNQEKAELLIDQEGSTSGKYSNDLIQSLNLSDLQLFVKLSEDKSSTLDLSGDNSENYALLLASQIKNKPELQILACQYRRNIFYQALVIAGDNMETAREFLKFLKSDSAKNILRDNGFTVD